MGGRIVAAAICSGGSGRRVWGRRIEAAGGCGCGRQGGKRTKSNSGERTEDRDIYFVGGFIGFGCSLGLVGLVHVPVPVPVPDTCTNPTLIYLFIR
jgi:hypothetical protein